MHVLLLYVHSSFAIILKTKRKLVALLLFLQMYCYYKCSVALPHGVVGWSAVCDCGIDIKCGNEYKGTYQVTGDIHGSNR